MTQFGAAEVRLQYTSLVCNMMNYCLVIYSDEGMYNLLYYHEALRCLHTSWVTNKSAQLWFRICKIYTHVSTRKDSNYLRYLRVDKWLKMEMYWYVLLNKISRAKVNTLHKTNCYCIFGNLVPVSINFGTQFFVMRVIKL